MMMLEYQMKWLGHMTKLEGQTPKLGKCHFLICHVLDSLPTGRQTAEAAMQWN